MYLCIYGSVYLSMYLYNVSVYQRVYLSCTSKPFEVDLRLIVSGQTQVRKAAMYLVGCTHNAWVAIDAGQTVTPVINKDPGGLSVLEYYLICLSIYENNIETHV